MKRFMSGAAAGRAGLVCAMLLVTQLAGCGGGGDSAAPPPVGGNPPVPPPPPPPPPPPTVSLTLEGVVTDEPIPNAVVTATVAGHDFTTTADAEGNYSLDIEIEEADAASFVTLHAQGVGDQAFVEFTSLAGSFQSLAAAAGDDDTLDATENFSTQITNVTTAAAALMQSANGGNPITDDAALASFGAQVNAQEVLDLATAIKLAVDEPETHPLPEGATILALANDTEARAQFVDTVFQQDPAAFAETQAAIAADPRLAQEIDEAALIEKGTLTAAMLSTDAGFTFNYNGRVVHYDLNADHTGWLSNDVHNVAITWAVEGKELRISYPNPIDSVSYDTEDCVGDGGVRQVEAHYVTSGAVVTFLNAKQVAITTSSDVTYADCESLQPHTVTATEARTVLSMDNAVALDAAEMPGSVQTLYVWDARQQTVVADIVDIGEGTGHARLTNQNFTWTLEEDGRLISADFANGAHADYASFGNVDELVADIYWEVRAPNDGPVLTGAGASVLAEPPGSMTVTAESVVGRFYQFGIGDETFPDPRLKGFRLRFDVNNFGAQENDFIGDNDAVVTTNETSNPANLFRWSIENNSVVVRRTWDTVAGVDGCLYTDANCELYDQRRLVPLAQQGSRLYVLEVRRMNFDGGINADTPTSFLVRYYDFEAPAGGVSKMRPVKVSGFKSRQVLKGYGMK